MTKRRLQCIFFLRNTIFIISLFFLEYHFLTRQSFLITDRRNYRRLYYILFSKKTFRTTFQILDIIFNPSIITDRRNSDRYKKKIVFQQLAKYLPTIRYSINQHHSPSMNQLSIILAILRTLQRSSSQPVAPHP